MRVGFHGGECGFGLGLTSTSRHEHFGCTFEGINIQHTFNTHSTPIQHPFNIHSTSPKSVPALAFAIKNINFFVLRKKPSLTPRRFG
jgi:hypothetical protein